MSDIFKLTKLTYLNISCNPLNDVLLDALAKLPLKSLIANNCFLPEEPRGFDKLTQLTHLSLKAINLEDIGEFSSLTQLKNLVLDENCLDTAGISGFTALTNLIELSVSNCNLSGLAKFPKLLSLQSLNLSYNLGLPKKCIASLSKLTTLTSLNLIGSGPTYYQREVTDLSGLTSLPNLRFLATKDEKENMVSVLTNLKLSNSSNN